MKKKLYIIIGVVVVVLLGVVGFVEMNKKPEQGDREQKSSSEVKKNGKSVRVSVEEIKAMYKDWTVEEEGGKMTFSKFDEDRNYFKAYYYVEDGQCKEAHYRVSWGGQVGEHAENIDKLNDLMMRGVPMLEALKFKGVSGRQFGQMKQVTDNLFVLEENDFKIEYYLREEMMPYLKVTTK